MGGEGSRLPGKGLFRLFLYDTFHFLHGGQQVSPAGSEGFPDNGGYRPPAGLDDKIYQDLDGTRQRIYTD
jgi:hypothetical protein